MVSMNEKSFEQSSEHKEDVLNKSFDSFDMSIGLQQRLAVVNIRTLADIVSREESYFLNNNIRGFSPIHKKELDTLLVELGLIYKKEE